MNKLVTTFFALSIILSACTKHPSVSQQDQDNSALAILDWKPLDFDYLILKSKINVKTKDNNVNATANIRIKRDSIIWISVTPGMGIEIIRSIITPDSVKIINRLENKYDKYSITYLKETLGIDLNFYNLQNLLVGDLLLPLEKQDQVKELQLDELWEINQERENVFASSRLSKTQKKVTRLEAQNKDQKYLRVNYSNFTIVDSLLIHQSQAMLLVNHQDSSFLETSHQKIEFPSKNVAFPFSVPKKYEK